MNEQLDDESLRVIALEHAVNIAKECEYVASEEIVRAAEAFYNFLKGNRNENVQAANH